eukprot:3744573-Alexandrium_andersonii.AAC.1
MGIQAIQSIYTGRIEGSIADSGGGYAPPLCFAAGAGHTAEPGQRKADAFGREEQSFGVMDAILA